MQLIIIHIIYYTIYLFIFSPYLMRACKSSIYILTTFRKDTKGTTSLEINFHENKPQTRVRTQV